ncbi:stalk domain-containing protein [Paenibacillus daejeonensis]|uniref:stalk domain-containing protein n=1 Tax=Paenibacillus daejeonensis TaxID=135193 RepID=UPI00037A980F|nr:stalk domain-containing protein [Paenibacillus daejeonensis]
MKKKWIASIAVASMLVGSSAGALAASNLQEIKAFFDSGLKFKLHGKDYVPANDKGVPTLPITYNGTTYLPVRAISNALDVAISYDPQTKTISLGEKSEGTPIADGFNNMYHTKDPALTTFNGKDYKEVFFDNAPSNRGSSFMLYPKGKYQKLVLQIAAIGHDIETLKINDSGKDIVLKTETIAVGEGLKTIEIDIGGVQELFIHADVEAGGKVFVPLTTSYYK